MKVTKITAKGAKVVVEVKLPPRTKVTPSVCRCGAPILIGPDDHVMAFPVRVDPVALNPQGELMAWAARRPTYTLDGGRLWFRDLWHIRRYPHEAYDVYPAHRCKAPVPPPWRRTTPLPSKSTYRSPDECPF